MPPLEQMDCHDDALLWRLTGAKNRNGRRLVDPVPVAIKCRWMRLRRDLRQPNGEIVSTEVQLISRDTALAVGDVLWKGSDDDLPGTGTGTGETPTSDLYEVVVDDTAQDIKGRVTRLEYALARYKDSLETS